MEEESGVVPTTNLPVGMTSLFNVVNSIMKDKNITGGVINFLPPLDAVSTGLEPMDLPKCPKCGFTIENILTTGKAGCAVCYEFFKDELKTIVEKCQDGAIQHKGKKPKGHIQPKLSLEAMEAELKEAIKAENYALAAKLRDEIKKLKSE
jgi:protein arginine kinase activator